MLWHWVPTKDSVKELGSPIPHLVPLSLPLGWGSWLPVPGQHCSQSLSALGQGARRYFGITVDL